LKTLLSKRNDNGNSQSPILPDEPSMDPVLELTRDFNVLMLKESKMAHYGSTSYMSVLSNDPILRDLFKHYIATQNWGINFNKFFLYDQGVQSNPPDVGNCTSGSSVPSASIFEADLNKNHADLVNTINTMLPKKDILDGLIDHFFAETYAFVPFIDEKAFRKNMESLISINSEGRATLVLNNAALLVTVSLLLTVLRFAAISLPAKKNVSTNLSETAKFLLDSGATISPTYIEYAKACIANASALRKPTLKHIQALLMLRLYRFLAPEDADESTDSTIFLALIIQMAKMHGLHRDPTSFSVVSDHATANLWRKIWAQLMYLDAVQAFAFGCPLLIDDEYDTSLPLNHPSHSPIEKSCIESFRKQDEVSLLYREIVKTSSKIKNRPKRSDLENTLKQVEFAIQRYPDISELCSAPEDGFVKKVTMMKDLAAKISLYNLHCSTNYILMLTCAPEELGATQKYTTRAVESGFVLFRLYHQFSNNQRLFNKDLIFEPFLTAFIFETSKRISQIVFSLCFRSMSNQLNLARCLNGHTFNDSTGILTWLRPLSDTVTIGDQTVIRFLEFIEFASRLQHRYFVCWRLLFVSKLYFDYLDKQFPGRLEKLDSIAKEFKQSATDKLMSQNYRVDLNLQAVQDAMNTDNNETHNESTAFWKELVDSSKQSKFDYLTPDFDKFKDVGDPYFNDNGYSGSSAFTFQDYNYILENHVLNDDDDDDVDRSALDNNAAGIFSNQADFSNIFENRISNNSISTSDGISPTTDIGSEDSNSKTVQLTSQMNLPDEYPLITEDDEKNLELNDHDVALQIATAMFGGSSALFENDFNL
jgi:hypothetical protein